MSLNKWLMYEKLIDECLGIDYVNGSLFYFFIVDEGFFICYLGLMDVFLVFCCFF